MIRDHKVTRGWPHRVDTVHTIPILSGQDLDSDSGCDNSTPLSSKSPCLVWGLEFSPRNSQQPVIVSQASRQDVIIMKDSVLKGHGVKRTTQGDFQGGGGPIVTSVVCQLSLALLSLPER